MDTLTARTWAQIDLRALKHNLDVAKRCGKPVMCVIKADAYGHGALRCGKLLQSSGAAAFAVACIDEAIELRNGGITLPILILGYTWHGFAKTLADNSLTQTVVDETAANELSIAAQAAGVTVDAHIKVDTGMSRAGILAQGKRAAIEAADAAERIMGLPGLNVTGMYTHFSVADTPEENGYTEWQLENYMHVLNELTARGKRPAICHTSNSAAIMQHSETIIDMVRAGVMLYGMYPDSMPRTGELELEPVMTLKSRVSQVRELPAGTTVSYGRAYRAKTDITTAVITAGYADGYSRRLSDNAYVVIKGRRYSQIGHICMDMIMADVTGGDVCRGDEVILFGKGAMSMEEVSQVVGTINYELTCLITPRARRVYING
ncbi:MAG: alanine racemase [Clostridia bacterium]